MTIWQKEEFKESLYLFLQEFTCQFYRSSHGRRRPAPEWTRQDTHFACGSLWVWKHGSVKPQRRLAATELRKWDMSTISCNLNYLKLDNLSKPEDHCSWVHHSAEDPVSSCGADVVVERTIRFLNWDQGAKAVRVVSRCHLKCFLLQGFTRLAFCNSLGGAFSSLFYFFLVVCTLTMMVSVSRRLVSKYLILEITGLMVVLLENTTSPLKLIPKLVQIVFLPFILSSLPICVFPLD